MKKRGRWLGILLILVLIAFSSSASYAEGWSIWAGKWFKLTEKISGKTVNESGSIVTLSYSQTIYLFIEEVKEDEGDIVVLHCKNYDYRDGQLKSTGDVDMRVLVGNSFDFLWWVQMGPEVNDGVSVGLAGRIQVKIKKGVLVGGTLKSVGGFGAAIVDDAPAVAGINWSGSMVSESKVPPEEPVM
jgi:hypothetical protein